MINLFRDVFKNSRGKFNCKSNFAKHVLEQNRNTYFDIEKVQLL